MILKGNQRGHGRDLALHLLNVEDNEHAFVHELRGFLADDLMEAFKETEAISLGTKCQQYLFSLSLNPPPDADVPVADFEVAIQHIEAKLGLSGQPRAIVFHEKNARRHAHCVWSRINVATMRAVNLPHFKRRLQEVARELYRTYGWDMPAGFERSDDRDPNTFDRVEAAQAKSARQDPKALKAMFQAAWEQSDSRAALAAALQEQGFILAQGSKRSFVAVDASGKVLSLSRWTGAGAEAVRSRLGSAVGLPSVEEAVSRFETATLPQSEAKSDELKDMVARQRQERRQLKADQEARTFHSLKDRQARLPTGLREAWAHLTGQYQSLVREMEAELNDERLHHQNEWDALIASHLTERRALQSVLDHRLNFDAMLEAANQSRLATDPRQHLALPQDDVPPSILAIEFRPEAILDHLSMRSEAFTEKEITTVLRRVHKDPAWCDTILDHLLNSQELVRLSSDGEARYTTLSYQKAETQLYASATALSGVRSFGINKTALHEAIRKGNRTLARIGGSLSNEQIAALKHATDASALSCIVGYAGAGKSTMLETARLAWEASGREIVGLALSGKAADGLESSSGIRSRTIASLETSWKNGHEPFPHGSIVVIDEVGMVGTRQLSRILNALAKRNCKAVLVGDPEQLQPIEAGAPFRDLLARHDHAKLSQVRRQSKDWQRDASVDLAEGRVEQALAAYELRDCVTQIANQDQALAKLAKDYLSDLELHGDDTSRLALAHRRKDVFALNQAIRAGRIAVGELNDEVLVETYHGPRAFAVGDRIQITRNDSGLGLRNGMLGRVLEAENEKLSVMIDGRAQPVTISTRTFDAIDHGYAVSIHKSQGATVDRSFVLGSKTMVSVRSSR